MGIFDNFKSSSAAEYKPTSEAEAWMSLMFACVAVDGNVSEIETDQIARTFTAKKLFAGHNIADLYTIAYNAHLDHGSKKLIDASAPIVAPERRSSLFIFLMEMVLADGVIDHIEKEIIEYASEALQLKQDFVEKVVDVMLTRNQDNYRIV